MEYTYISIYRFEGISCNDQTGEQSIYNSQSPNITAFLTNNPNQHCTEIDTGLAYLSLMYTGKTEEEILSNIKSTRQEIQNERRKERKPGAILVIKIKGDADLSINKKLHRETKEFHICHGAVDKDSIKKDHQSTIQSILTSLSISTGSEYQAENLIDNIYFRDTNGKLLFSYEITGGKARLILSKIQDSDKIENISKLIDISEKNSQLNSVFRLFSQSLEANQNRFKAFLSIWSATEIFVNKSFTYYEEKFISKVSGNHDSNGVDRFMERVQSVMKDKYRLYDKFVLIASYLSPNLENDLKLFKKIKKTRDQIYHGITFNDDELPVEETRELVSIYLKNHMEMKDQDRNC